MADPYAVSNGCEYFRANPEKNSLDNGIRDFE